MTERTDARAQRVAERHLAMAAILRGVPGNVDWGFFSREDERMHLQTIDEKRVGKFKYWLERDGQRVFEAESAAPGRIHDALIADIRTAGTRRHVEAKWVMLMIHKGWLTLDYRAPITTLRAYPGGREFTRTIDLSRELLEPPTDPSEVVLSAGMASLQVFPSLDEADRVDIFLPDVLWEGQR